METIKSKIFIFIFALSSLCWLGAGIMKNIQIGNLIEFGTVEFKQSLTVGSERTAYDAIAKCSVIAFIAYPIVLLSGIGYLKTTLRIIKTDGWLLMCALLLFMFVPVEFYCFWLDWKLVGLNYWGNWELEEFRKAFLLRLTALAGLHFIAQFCYYTIPILVLWKPFSKKAGKE